MLDNLYLIAHKVRGEVGFDIAMRCEDMGTPSDPGPWWISQTWGWRAYPIDYWPLNQLLYKDGTGDVFHLLTPDMPPDATDIFEQSDDARKMSGADLAEGQSLLLQLGLVKPKDPINRRGI